MVSTAAGSAIRFVVMLVRALSGAFVAFIGLVLVRSGYGALRTGDTGSAAFIGGVGLAFLGAGIFLLVTLVRRSPGRRGRGGPGR